MLAQEENCMDEFFQSAGHVLAYLKKDDSFLRLAERPDIPREEKKHIAEMIFSPMLPSRMTGLIILLIEKGRALQIVSVFERFLRLVQEEKGIGHVYVTTSHSLSEEKKERIRNRLSQLTDYNELCMHYAVDQELLGGMVIRIGDRMMDASVRTKLRTLSRTLCCVQNHQNQKGIQDP